MFNPEDNWVIYSTGDKDGIYVWKFYGETAAAPGNPDGQIGQEIVDRSDFREPTELEKMRNMVGELKKPQLLTGSFVVPAFSVQENVSLNISMQRRETSTFGKLTPE